MCNDTTSIKFSWQSHCPHPDTLEICNPVVPLPLLPALHFAKKNHKKGLPLTNLAVKRYHRKKNTNFQVRFQLDFTCFLPGLSKPGKNAVFQICILQYPKLENYRRPDLVLVQSNLGLTY